MTTYKLLAYGPPARVSLKWKHSEGYNRLEYLLMKDKNIFSIGSKAGNNEVRFFYRKALAAGVKHFGHIQSRDEELSCYLNVNCQDSVLVRECSLQNPTVLIGLVSDGCSNRLNPLCHTEVGASLSCLFATRFIVSQLQDGVELSLIPGTLYANWTNYLRRIAELTMVGSVDQERDLFIHYYLTATLVGFVVDREETIVFASGDGFAQINNEQIFFNQRFTPPADNPRQSAPMYAALHNISSSQFPEPLPSNFDVRLIPTRQIERLLISTDGIIIGDDPAIVADDAKEAAFNHQPLTAKGFQHWLNLQQLTNRRFADDVATVSLEHMAISIPVTGSKEV